MKSPDSDRSSIVRRRDVVRLAGAAAVGSVAFAGTANAHHVDCIYFCGCGRMVAYGGLPKRYPVLVAEEGGGPRPADPDHYPERGDSNDNVGTTQRGRGKILAFVVEDQVWYNPNGCAQNVFDEYGGVEAMVEEQFFEELDLADRYEKVDEYDEETGFNAGERGHCHPPREDEPGEHDHCEAG